MANLALYGAALAVTAVAFFAAGMLMVRGRGLRPGALVAVSVLALTGAVLGLVVVPAATVGTAPSRGARSYTDLELEGRRVYIREGCWYCHTQGVRPQDAGAGPVSVAGDYFYDAPALPGPERLGPDLSNVGGGRFTDAWQKEHLKNPRALAPGSIMPAYTHLTEKEMQALVAYLQALGARRVKGADLDVPETYRIGPDGKPIEPKIPVAPNTANVGYGIYLANCAVCHGMGGRGDGPAAALFARRPADLAVTALRSPQYIYWRIAEGVPGTVMPKWKLQLHEEQIWYLVAYVKTLEGLAGRPPETGGDAATIPDKYRDLKNPQPRTPDVLQAGQALYAKNCAACHGLAGRGDGPGAAGLAPPPADFTNAKYQAMPDGFFFWIVTEGKAGTAMPSWESLLTTDERWQVIRYIRAFHGQ